MQNQRGVGWWRSYPVHLRFFGLHDLVIDTESFLLDYRESLNAETREQRLMRLGFEPVTETHPGYTVGDALGITPSED